MCLNVVIATMAQQDQVNERASAFFGVGAGLVPPAPSPSRQPPRRPFSARATSSAASSRPGSAVISRPDSALTRPGSSAPSRPASARSVQHHVIRSRPTSGNVNGRSREPQTQSMEQWLGSQEWQSRVEEWQLEQKALTLQALPHASTAPLASSSGVPRHGEHLSDAQHRERSWVDEWISTPRSEALGRWGARGLFDGGLTKETLQLEELRVTRRFERARPAEPNAGLVSTHSSKTVHTAAGRSAALEARYLSLQAEHRLAIARARNSLGLLKASNERERALGAALAASRQELAEANQRLTALGGPALTPTAGERAVAPDRLMRATSTDRNMYDTHAGARARAILRASNAPGPDESLALTSTVTTATTTLTGSLAGAAQSDDHVRTTRATAHVSREASCGSPEVSNPSLHITSESGEHSNTSSLEEEKVKSYQLQQALNLVNLRTERQQHTILQLTAKCGRQRREIKNLEGDCRRLTAALRAATTGGDAEETTATAFDVEEEEEDWIQRELLSRDLSRIAEVTPRVLPCEGSVSAVSSSLEAAPVSNEAPSTGMSPLGSDVEREGQSSPATAALATEVEAVSELGEVYSARSSSTAGTVSECAGDAQDDSC